MWVWVWCFPACVFFFCRAELLLNREKKIPSFAHYDAVLLSCLVLHSKRVLLLHFCKLLIVRLACG
jgi:hypothetical protein